MNNVIEDMSRDEATTYFIGNPGYGIASRLPQGDARLRRGDGLLQQDVLRPLARPGELHVVRACAATTPASSGPETGQLDPNINSDFDLISLLANRTGPLPGDRTHQLKVFGAKEFLLSGAMQHQPGPHLPRPLRRAAELPRLRTPSTAPTRSSSSRAAPPASSLGAQLRRPPRLQLQAVEGQHGHHQRWTSSTSSTSSRSLPAISATPCPRSTRCTRLTAAARPAPRPISAR